MAKRKIITRLPTREFDALRRIVRNDGRLANWHIRDNTALDRLIKKELIELQGERNDILVATEEGVQFMTSFVRASEDALSNISLEEHRRLDELSIEALNLGRQAVTGTDISVRLAEIKAERCQILGKAIKGMR